MAAPIRAAPVRPVRTLAPSQRRLTPWRSTAAAPPPTSRGGSWPRSKPWAPRSPAWAAFSCGRLALAACVLIKAGTWKGHGRAGDQLAGPDHARDGRPNQCFGPAKVASAQPLQLLVVPLYDRSEAAVSRFILVSGKARQALLETGGFPSHMGKTDDAETARKSST